MKFEAKVKCNCERLLKKSDKLVLALSGGKDSMTTLYLLKKFGYNVTAVMIDMGFKHFKTHVANAKKLCKELSVDLEVVKVSDLLGTDMRTIHKRVQANQPMSNCMICGVFKRWILNNKAKELGADKLITGHNLDDYAESVIMNLIMNNHQSCLGLGDETGLINDDVFVDKVKVLNNVTEEEIKNYSESKGLKINYDICPYSSEAFRREVKNVIKDLDKHNIVKFFQQIKPRIEDQFFKKGELKKCKICGEATRSSECQACQLKKLI